MKIIDKISEFTSIDSKYWILAFKTLVFFLILDIVKKIIIENFKKLKDSKKEYSYTRKLKTIIFVIKFFVFIFIWNVELSSILNLITFVSAAVTFSLRDIILNFFGGIYINLNKPFSVEDRIEVDNYKGDVVNINALNFELLEVDNSDMMGQSTGVIMHVPNSIVFSKPIRNYDKLFKYVWNEIEVNVPLTCNVDDVRKVLYRIVNKNDVIEHVPAAVKKSIREISTDYRIYYSEYKPVIYTKVMGDYVSYTIRYLVDPRKSRYVNSSIWKHILKAYHNKEIELYNKSVEYSENI